MAVPATLENTTREFYCSANVTARVHDELIVLLVLNTFLSITAFLENTLILVALHKEYSLHPPSKLLLRSLAITDLLVGIIVEPLNVAYLMSVKSKRWDICYNVNVALFIASYILCSVSLLVLTAISVDRLLALLLGLRYRQVVTLRSVYITVIVMGFAHCRHNKLHLESSVAFIASLHTFVSLFIHYNFLLHENLLHAPSLPNSSHCGSRTTEASNSTEHSSIQKGSVQRTVGAGYIIYLLSAIWHNTGLNWKR